MNDLTAELKKLLEVKENLLHVSLNQGSMLPRDDVEFLNWLKRSEKSASKIEDRHLRQDALKILGLIRQFNPFNTSDMDENEMLSEVIEDFLYFTRDRIEKLDNKIARGTKGDDVK